MHFVCAKPRVRILLLTLSLGTVVCRSPEAAVLPLGQPEYDFLYEQQHRRDARQFDAFDLQVGPYLITRFDGRLGPFADWSIPDSSHVRLFGFAAQDFHAVRESRPVGYESVRAGLVGEPFRRLSIYADFILDEELAEDPSYGGKKWRGFAGDIDQAFATYTVDRFNLIAGRFGGFWGPRQSLVFSPNQKLDGFGYTVRWGRASVSYRLGSLDGLNPDEDDVVQHEPRYIAAHQFDWHFGPRLRAGVFETVVFGGPGRQIDLFYLNPLIFYHGSQLNEALNDNTIVGFDFDAQPVEGLLVYGQLLIDDLQIDNKTRSDQEPAQLGILAGGYLADALVSTDLQFEYERVSNWTFNQMHARNRYLNDGRPIGSAQGNDYDMTTLRVIRWWREQLQTSLRFSYYRQGEGRVEADWTQPWTEGDGDYSEPFPTGVVEKTGTLSLGLKGFVTDFAFLDFQAGVDWVRDRGHVAGDHATLPFVNIYLSIFGLSQVGLD
ncbi:MAG: capsule assembly Wzi family protein [Candidatus Zixiibacteriota bacterium]